MPGPALIRPRGVWTARDSNSNLPRPFTCRGAGSLRDPRLFPRHQSRKNKINLHSIFSSTYIHPPLPSEPKSRTPPATIQTESRQGKSTRGGSKKPGNKRCGARLQTCCVAISGNMSLPAFGPRVSRSVREKIDRITRKTAPLSWSLTPGHPASSTQTIENKDTIRRHGTPDSQNGQKYAESMTKPDIL